MSLWTHFQQCRREFARRGDEERLRLTQLHSQGFELQEVDPDQALAIYTEARHLAQQLDEPWFVFFYDVWRVIAMTSYQKDFRHCLDLAVQCVLAARKPPHNQHPWHFAAYNNLLNIYLHTDPLGHAENIQQTLDYLETEVAPGPGSDRYVMLFRKARFAIHRRLYSEAQDVYQHILSLGDSDHDRHRAHWHGVVAHCNLAWLAHLRDDWEDVADHAQQAEEIARRTEQCELDLAEALMWQAVLARRTHEEEESRRLLRGSLGRISRLRITPTEEFYDAQAYYHELGDNLERALQVRERELERLIGRGQTVLECEVHIKRCRLLARMGKLTAADLDAARAVAKQMKRPEVYLEQMEAIQK